MSVQIDQPGKLVANLSVLRMFFLSVKRTVHVWITH